jgi:hypothetical protein
VAERVGWVVRSYRLVSIGVLADEVVTDGKKILR